MVIITINGEKKEREFQNMAQALAFAYQNGECYNAEKIEIAYAAKEPEQKPEEKPVGTPIGPEGTSSQSGAGVDNQNQAGEDGSGDLGNVSGDPDYIKTLEKHTHKELVAYAKELKINVGLYPKDADLIAAIRAAQVATKVDEPSTPEAPQESTGNPEETLPTTGASKEAGVDSTDQTL